MNEQGLGLKTCHVGLRRQLKWRIFIVVGWIFCARMTNSKSLFDIRKLVEDRFQVLSEKNHLTLTHPKCRLFPTSLAYTTIRSQGCKMIPDDVWKNFPKSKIILMAPPPSFMKCTKTRHIRIIQRLLIGLFPDETIAAYNGKECQIYSFIMLIFCGYLAF